MPTASEAERSLKEMERIAALPLLSEDAAVLRDAAANLRVALASAVPQASDGSPLSALPTAERATYERMFELIYECSVNRVAARKLIERITARVSGGPVLQV
jgi:molecular chaperone HtpG